MPGVQIWTSSRVTAIDSNGARLGGEFVNATTVIWAAGVQPSVLSKALKVELDDLGRVLVEKNLTLKSQPNIFVIGDQALFHNKEGRLLPGVAPVVIQQGHHVATNILNAVAGKPLTDFRYLDKGMMATIGRSKAIVQVGGFRITGFIAWAAWLFVHIFYLIGVKNKIFVFSQWTWLFLTFKRGARLIIDKEWRSHEC